MNKEYMLKALELAKKSLVSEDVPVGAVIVKDNKIIGEGYNRREKDGDPTAHAEIIAIKEAAKSLGNWRLDDCELYVTLEPCSHYGKTPPCCDLIIKEGIKRVVIGTTDNNNFFCLDGHRLHRNDKLQIMFHVKQWQNKI